MSIRQFIDHNYRHFNAASLRDAARGYVQQIESGNKMLVSLGGAMSTAELGLSLAKMIRQDKVHAISCTGANLEEDMFNLVAHDHYRRIPEYRDLTAEDEAKLLEQGLNRVTDTCIPEEEAMRKIERHLIDIWKKADAASERKFPFEFMYELIRSNVLRDEYQIDPKDSWLVAASEKNIPIWTPGWEDSTLGNMITALMRRGVLTNFSIVRNGLEAMNALIDWYQESTKEKEVGFFQVAGGIAGDYPICVVPLIAQDLKVDAKVWSYFCQISDSTTSYGSYSGAVPNEKITWGKLSVETPKYIIESDATIVAPLLFSYVLGE
jgi:deoxyhypusine synthase